MFTKCLSISSHFQNVPYKQGGGGEVRWKWMGSEWERNVEKKDGE